MTASFGVRRVRVPFRVPFATAAGTWTARESLLVALQSDDGSRGVGEVPIETGLTTAELSRHIGRLMDGPGEGVPEDIRLAFGAGLGGALLDLAPAPDAVAAAVRAGVGVNATIPATGVDDAVLAAAAAIGAGYRTIKLKAGPQESTAALVERVRAVRQAVGPRVAVRLDVNGAWHLDAAVERLRALEPFALQYVEQPLPASDRTGARSLRRRIGTPIAADESVRSPEAAMELVRAGAADVLVVKLARVGGPGALAAIAEAAAGHGVPVVVSSLFETGVGLAAAIACASSLPDVPGWPAADRDHGLATADVLEHDLLVTPLVLEAGRIRAPFAPAAGGLGIALDEAAVERYAVDDA